MTNILMVDDSTNLLASMQIAIEVSTSQFNILVAENGEEAINTLGNTPVDVLVTDLYMPKVDGLELLAYMSQHHPETPCIVMTAYSSSEVKEILDNLGVYRFLEKPFGAEDLLAAITGAASQTDKSKTKGMSTASFLQLLQEEQRSCTLEATRRKGPKGYFHVVDGLLHDAECGNLHGEEAAINILGWENVSLNIKDLPPDDIKAHINLSLNALIAKADSQNKENKKKEGQKKVADKTDHTEILFRAIRRAESGDTAQAQKSLAKLLKSNPKNSKAWLWFARTAGSFKAVNASLKNAATISPDDPEIAREIKKTNSAVKSGWSESSSFRHCFFCWAPVIKEHTTCHYCNAHLDIHEEFFRSTLSENKNEPDLKIMLESFQRFTKATILEGKNIQARFFLAMAHINLDQWEEALAELKKAKQLDPDKFPYQKQLDVLSDVMDGIGSFGSSDSQEEEAASPPEKTGKGEKFVMVVEDSTTTRTVIRRMLTQEGYNVIEARDGIEAIAKFSEKQPDLILLDIIMPGLDGYQTLTTLKKNHDLSSIPVIMLTAKDSLIDKLKGKVSGSTEYLTKPFKALELIKKINQYLN